MLCSQGIPHPHILPTLLDRRNTQNGDLLRIPQQKMSAFKSSPEYNAITWCSKLPFDVRRIGSKSSFRNGVETLLLEKGQEFLNDCDWLYIYLYYIFFCCFHLFV